MLYSQALAKHDPQITKDLLIEYSSYRCIIDDLCDILDGMREKFHQVTMSNPERVWGSPEIKVTISGPESLVNKCCMYLEDLIIEVLDYTVKVPISKNVHKLITGLGKAHIKRITDKTHTTIDIAKKGAEFDHIIIRGRKTDVLEVEEKILAIQEKLDNFIIEEIVIPPEFFNSIIGFSGVQIKSIIEECGDVTVKFPTVGTGSDIVTIRGPKRDVLKAKELLMQIRDEKVLVEVEANPDIYKHLIGQNGNNVNRLSDFRDVFITFPKSNEDDKSTINIVGREENVKKAEADLNIMIEKQGRVEIKANPELYRYLIGRKGKNIEKICTKTGAKIVFPKENDDDKSTITIIGTKEEIEAAKTDLNNMIEKLQNAVESTMDIDPKHHHYFLVGGAEVLKQVSKDCGDVTVTFPPRGSNSSKVVLKGTLDVIEATKRRFQEIVKDLEDIVTFPCVIPHEYHRTVLGAKGSNVKNIQSLYNVTIKFPERETTEDSEEESVSREDNLSGSEEESVSREDGLPDSKEKSVRREVGLSDSKEESVSRKVDLSDSEEESVSCEDDLSDSEEESVSEDGVSGVLEDKTNQRDVIKGRVENCKESTSDDDSSYVREDGIIIIKGKRENCEAAYKALKDSVPVIEKMKVPQDLHAFIIGPKGECVQNIIKEYDVMIKFPPKDEQSDVIIIRGAPKNIARAKRYLEGRIDSLERQKEYKRLESFQLTVEVDPHYHSNIIERRGAKISVSKIQEKHMVKIDLPEPHSANDRLITITGFEKRAEAAREAILKLVQELEDMFKEEVSIDSRFHAALIGCRGRQVTKIMERFNVDIRFPRPSDPDPDLVVIRGDEYDVLGAKDYLLSLVEDYRKTKRLNKPLK